MSHMVFALAVILSAPDGPSKQNKVDLRKMQGDWMVATMKVNGTILPDDQAQALFRTVEGNEYTVSRYSKAIASGAFKIDASESPRAIDSTPANSVDGKPLLGIYEFDGNKLRICNARPGKPRPKTFDAKLLSGHTLIAWEPEQR